MKEKRLVKEKKNFSYSKNSRFNKKKRKQKTSVEYRSRLVALVSKMIKYSLQCFTSNTKNETSIKQHSKSKYWQTKIQSSNKKKLTPLPNP